MNFTKTHHVFLPALLLAIAGPLLGGCMASTAPLQITNISVTPEPVIGQTATLRVEVMSKYDEPNAAIIIDLPPGVKLMDGELLWEGSLKANHPQTHEISICVLYEGNWRLDIETYSILSETSSYENSEVLHIITSGDTAKAVYGKDYHFTQPPGGMVHPTDVPKTPPADICQ